MDIFIMFKYSCQGLIYCRLLGEQGHSWTLCSIFFYSVSDIFDFISSRDSLFSTQVTLLSLFTVLFFLFPPPNKIKCIYLLFREFWVWKTAWRNRMVTEFGIWGTEAEGSDLFRITPDPKLQNLGVMSEHTCLTSAQSHRENSFVWILTWIVCLHRSCCFSCFSGYRRNCWTLGPPW